jgi:actin-related protein
MLKEIFIEPVSVISASNVSKRNVTDNTVKRSGPEWDYGASDVLVLQFGSKNLRIGMARDAFPKLIPLCVATSSEVKANPRRNSIPLEDFSPSKGIINFNKTQKPESISEHNDIDSLEWQIPKTVVTGLGTNKVDLKYQRRYPISQGRFNFSNYENWRQVQNDLEIIIRGEVKRDLKQLRLLIVIDELMTEEELAALIDLCLNQLRVIAVTFITQAVAACYGSGISSGLVIDLGASRTCVTAVEDGNVIQRPLLSSTINLLENLMRSCLEKQGWPKDSLDFIPLDKLLTLDISERENHQGHAVEVMVRHMEQDARRYELRSGQERFLVPHHILFEGFKESNESTIQHPPNKSFFSGVPLQKRDEEDTVEQSPPLEFSNILEMITEIFNSLTEDQLTKLSSSIVLVGGNALIPHLPKYLLDQLSSVGYSNCNIVGTLDPRYVSWKGGAVFSRLESVNESGWLTL